MKRLVGMLLVLVPVSLFVAGCGTGGGSSSAPTKFNKPEEMKKMPPGMKLMKELPSDRKK